MRDDLRPDEVAGSPRAPARTASEPEREVALPRTRVIPAQVHAWLDGEGTEEAARRAGGARDVELWKRIDGVISPRRGSGVPLGFLARLMEALP